MEKKDTTLPGVYVIEPDVFEDHRGYFMETYSKVKFEKIGISNDFVQDNQSFTKAAGTIRGIHFQNKPFAQAKLVRVTKGAIIDVVVDLRKGSPTYKKWISIELSEKNKKMLFIPHGFGHGFKTLTDNVKFCYKVDCVYSKEYDRGIRYNDPSINVDWGFVDESLLSLKDQMAPLLVDSDCNFEYQDSE